MWKTGTNLMNSLRTLTAFEPFVVIPEKQGCYACLSVTRNFITQQLSPIRLAEGK